jgi:hypothetical protein
MIVRPFALFTASIFMIAFSFALQTDNLRLKGSNLVNLSGSRRRMYC